MTAMASDDNDHLMREKETELLSSLDFLDKLELESPVEHIAFLKAMVSFIPNHRVDEYLQTFKLDKHALQRHIYDVVFKAHPKVFADWQNYLKEVKADDEKLPDYLRRGRRKSKYCLTRAESEMPRGHILNDGFCVLKAPHVEPRGISPEEDTKLTREDARYEAHMSLKRAVKAVKKLVLLLPSAPASKATEHLTQAQFELIKHSLMEKRFTQETMEHLSLDGWRDVALRLRMKRKESRIKLLEREIQGRQRWRKLQPLAGEGKEDKTLKDLRSRKKRMESKVELLNDDILINQPRKKRV